LQENIVPDLTDGESDGEEQKEEGKKEESEEEDERPISYFAKRILERPNLDPKMKQFVSKVAGTMPEAEKTENPHAKIYEKRKVMRKGRYKSMKLLKPCGDSCSDPFCPDKKPWKKKRRRKRRRTNYGI